MAITASHVYQTVIDIVRADKRGLTLSEDEYNRVARLVNERLYARYYSNFEANIDNIDVMGGFKVLGEVIPLVAGVGSLPDDYYQVIGKPRLLKTYTGVNLVSSLELAERLQDYLTQPTLTHPCFILGGEDGAGNTEVNVYPITITEIELDYLRTANVPFLDYYVNDTTLVSTYLAAGATGVTVPLGSTYRTGVQGVVVVNSVTVDWEWSDSDLPLIVAMFCSYIGIQKPDQLLIEVGNVDESKN
jgi:hypothetical protein